MLDPVFLATISFTSVYILAVDPDEVDGYLGQTMYNFAC
jgi:hypothetical protein